MTAGAVRCSCSSPIPASAATSGSARLSVPAVAAGRPHEVLPLTGATHRVSDETADENLLWHEVRFLRRHLA